MKKFEQWRKANGLTYAAVAEKAGGRWKGATIRRYVRGERRPPPEWYTVAQRISGLTFEELMSDQDTAA